MHDHELKKLLEETHAVRPGQEERAWNALRERLTRSAPVRRAWFYIPPGRAAAGVAALALVALGGSWLFLPQSPAPGLVSAESQSPGIYATAFYSKSAHAQVVWLSGMDPASDRPTYLDPTSARPASATHNVSGGDPNSL